MAKKNPADLTLRNLHAARKRLDALTAIVVDLNARVLWLESKIVRLSKAEAKALRLNVSEALQSQRR